MQRFCVEAHFQHALPLGRSSMTRWRQRIGPERLHQELRRITMQAVLAPAETAAMLFSALPASGRISIHKVDSW